MAAASMLRRTAGPLRRSAWKLLQEPTHLAALPAGSASSLSHVPSSNLVAFMRIASTKRKASKERKATKASSLPRILKNDDINHKDEKQEPSRRNVFQIGHLIFVEEEGAFGPNFDGPSFSQMDEQMHRQFKKYLDFKLVTEEKLAKKFMPIAIDEYLADSYFMLLMMKSLLKNSGLLLEFSQS